MGASYDYITTIGSLNRTYRPEVWMHANKRARDVEGFANHTQQEQTLRAGNQGLHYTTLHCTALHCTALHCTALHCTALHYTTLHYTTLHYTALHYTTLHYTTLHYTTLHYRHTHTHTHTYVR